MDIITKKNLNQVISIYKNTKSRLSFFIINDFNFYIIQIRVIKVIVSLLQFALSNL